MKKMHRIFALILAMAMVLGLMTTASAAEPNIIDGSQTGSITVHKYQEDSFLDNYNYLTQGEMADYIDSLGDQLTPLADVTFRYLKVGDVKQYTKYVTDQSTGKTTNVVKIGYSLESDLAALIGLDANDVDITINGVNYYSVTVLDKALNTVSATKIEQYINSESGYVDMAPTDANGESTASGLALGLYLLCEYSYPANTVGNEQHGHSVPCLIPIPLTDSAADGTYNWTYDVHVYPKNIVEEITNDKVIVGNDNNETKEFDAEIGESVEFLIRSDVPHAIGKLQTYTINDTLSAGLDYDTGSYKVYGVTSSGTRALLSVGQQFSFTNADSHNMSWTFNTARLADGEGWAIYDAIEIRYTATVNKDAVVGSSGNENSVETLISHTTNTDTSSNPEKVDRYVPTTLPKVFTYALDLTKYGDSDSTDPLEDVTFELQDANGKVITVSEQVSSVKGAYYFAPNGTATLTTDADGKLYIKGFEAGTYYLKETATNNGFSLLADKIEIIITSNENTYTASATGTYAPVDTSKKYYTDETYDDTPGTSGIIPGTDTVINTYNWFVLPSISTSNPDTLVPNGTFVNFGTSDVHTADSSQVQMYEANKLTWSCNFSMGESRDSQDTGVVSIVINDQKIFELPHTGGIGNYWFLLGGGAVLAAAFAMVMVERRKSKKQ